jgi:hypothetical protein
MTRPLSALVVALLVVFAGCGADTERASSTSDAEALLRTTFANLAEIDSATVDMKVQVTPRGAAGDSPVGARVAGPFVSQGEGKLPKFALTSTMSDGSKTVTAGATWTGSKGFANLQGTDYEVSGIVMRQLEAGFSQALQSRNGAAAGLLAGVDFTRWLRNARNEGVEDLGGEQTIRVTGDADVARVVADLSTLGAGLQALGIPGTNGAVPSAQAKDRLIRSVKSLTVTVNTGASDSKLRRLVVRGDLKDEASKVDASLLLDLSLTRVGEDQTITEPSNPKPFADLMKVVGGSGLLAGVGIGGGGPGADVEALTQCVQQAGGDASKARACAEKLRHK